MRPLSRSQDENWLPPVVGEGGGAAGWRRFWRQTRGSARVPAGTGQWAAGAGAGGSGNVSLGDVVGERKEDVSGVKIAVGDDTSPWPTADKARSIGRSCPSPAAVPGFARWRVKRTRHQHAGSPSSTRAPSLQCAQKPGYTSSSAPRANRRGAGRGWLASAFLFPPIARTTLRGVEAAAQRGTPLLRNFPNGKAPPHLRQGHQAWQGQPAQDRDPRNVIASVARASSANLTDSM